MERPQLPCPPEGLTGEALLDAIVATACSLQARVRGLHGRPALTRGRLAILRQLARAGKPMRVSALARALGCTMSNITQITNRLLVQGFVDVVTYERKPKWRAVAINAEGRVALGEEDADAAVHAEAASEDLSPQERATLEALLRRMRCPQDRQVHPGKPRIIVSGASVRPRSLTPDAAEVSKRTPPDPEEEARRRREELIARARQQDPRTLQHWELAIWEFESQGIPAPEEYYEDAKLFRDLGVGANVHARAPP